MEKSKIYHLKKNVAFPVTIFLTFSSAAIAQFKTLSTYMLHGRVSNVEIIDSSQEYEKSKLRTEVVNLFFDSMGNLTKKVNGLMVDNYIYIKDSVKTTVTEYSLFQQDTNEVKIETYNSFNVLVKSIDKQKGGKAEIFRYTNKYDEKNRKIKQVYIESREGESDYSASTTYSYDNLTDAVTEKYYNGKGELSGMKKISKDEKPLEDYEYNVDGTVSAKTLYTYEKTWGYNKWKKGILTESQIYTPQFDEQGNVIKIRGTTTVYVAGQGKYSTPEWTETRKITYY